MCNDDWECAEVSPEGWQVIQRPPVSFRRARGMLGLPRPISGGQLRYLRPLVNLPGEREWVLWISYLVHCLRPRGPYFVLAVNGVQRSAKSTLCRLSRLLIDPNSAPMRAAPKNEQDLVIAARNGSVLAFDSVSWLPLRVSVALCRTTTAGRHG